jgi:hypothetical protein
MDARARFSSRKFWVVEQVILFTTVLAYFGKVTGEYSTIVSVCVGAYTFANAYVEGQRIKNGNDPS